MKVYDVIKNAKEIYMTEIDCGGYTGMCWCLKVAVTRGMDFKEKNRKGHPSYKDLVANIPEFCPEFFGRPKIAQPGLDFWWDNKETQPRLDAFDVLEDIYKESVRGFEY